MINVIFVALLFVKIFSVSKLTSRSDPIEDFNCLIGEEVDEFYYPNGLVSDGNRRSVITSTEYKGFDLIEQPEELTFTAEDDYGVDIDNRLEYPGVNFTGYVRPSASSAEIYVSTTDGNIKRVVRTVNDAFYELNSRSVYLDNASGEMGEIGYDEKNSKLFAKVGNDVLIYNSILAPQNKISIISNSTLNNMFVVIDNQKSTSSILLLTFQEDSTHKIAILDTSDGNIYGLQETPDNSKVVDAIVVKNKFAIRTENNNVYLFGYEPTMQTLEEEYFYSFTNNIKAFAYHYETSYIYLLVENEGLIALHLSFVTKYNVENTQNFDTVFQLEISEKNGDAILVAGCKDGFIMYYVQVSRITESTYQAMVLKSTHKYENVVATPSSEFNPCSSFYLIRNKDELVSIDLASAYDGYRMTGKCLPGTNKYGFFIQSDSASLYYSINMVGTCENGLECVNGLPNDDCSECKCENSFGGEKCDEKLDEIIDLQNQTITILLERIEKLEQKTEGTDNSITSLATAGSISNVFLWIIIVFALIIITVLIVLVVLLLINRFKKTGQVKEQDKSIEMENKQ